MSILILTGCTIAGAPQRRSSGKLALETRKPLKDERDMKATRRFSGEGE